MDDRQQTFLKHLAKTRNAQRARKLADIPRSTIYRWREVDEEFRRAWDAALGRAAAPPTGRIEVEKLTPRQRRLMRQFLATIPDGPQKAPDEPAPAAVDAWLEGKPWERLGVDAERELRDKWPRAWPDYVSAMVTLSPGQRARHRRDLVAETPGA